VTLAIAAARKDVREGLTLPVPPHLRDASYSGAARLGRGAAYKYPHDYPDGYVPQDYLGAARKYYNPTERGLEERLARALRDRRSPRPTDAP
jgi:putative ATPase